MEADYSFIWVLMIAVIGIGVSVYSLCKGCRGYSERGISARDLVAPYAGLLQQMRAEASRTGLFSISGNSVQDKNPPTYDELFAAPPPSYEESVRMLQEGFSSKPTDKANDDTLEESSTKQTTVNNCVKESQSVTIQPSAEPGQTANSDEAASANQVTIVVQEENDDLARRRASEMATTHTTAVVVDIEMERHTELASCDSADTSVVVVTV